MPQAGDTIYALPAWASYTPTVTGGGAATFSTQDGRWRPIGEKTVAFYWYLVVGTAGSGTTPITVALPSTPSRLIRQVWTGGAENPGDGLHGVIFQSGTGAVIDRIRNMSSGANYSGGSLTAGRLLYLSGVYEEE